MDAARCILRAVEGKVSPEQAQAWAQFVQEQMEDLSRALTPAEVADTLTRLVQAESDAAARRALQAQRCLVLQVQKNREALERVESQLEQMKGNVKEAFLADMVGTFQASAGGRRSAAALRQATEIKLLSPLAAWLKQNKDIERILNAWPWQPGKKAAARAFDEDVSRELYKPGSTQNAKAGELAAVMRQSWDALHERLNAARALAGVARRF
jgi:hypothetical protein